MLTNLHADPSFAKLTICSSFLQTSGKFRYERRSPQEPPQEGQPRQSADIALDIARTSLSTAQCRDMAHLLQAFASVSTRSPNSHLRPQSRPGKDPRGWCVHHVGTAHALSRCATFLHPWADGAKHVALNGTDAPSMSRRWRYAVSVIRPALGGIRIRGEDVARVAHIRRRYISVYSTAPSAAAAAAHKEIQAMDEELPFEAR